MNSNDESVKELQKVVLELKYPNSMRMVCGEIKGIGFFPGAIGNGISNLTTSIFKRKIMVLGQDQDNAKGFNNSINEGNEIYSPTWKQMTMLFLKAGIEISECFFTNSIMGIRSQSQKNTGKSPAFDDNVFMQECINILKEQIRLQQPNFIICLGLSPLKVLSCLSQEMTHGLVGIESFAVLDQNDKAVFKSIDIAGANIKVITIVHPSYRHLNIKHRRLPYRNSNDPEVELLKREIVDKLN